MRILVTGSSGQLGTEVARQLGSEHEVIGTDVRPGEWTTHAGDITDAGLIADLMRGVDVVIHIASLHAPHVGQRSMQDFVDTNVTGTLRLLEAASAAHVRRFVYTSTTSVYGEALVPDGQEAVWVTEDLTPRPRDIYDITKLAAEELCRLFARDHGLPAICLRVSRFFEQSPDLMASYRLYRGADVRDIAAAHLLAARNQDIAFNIFTISARSPFQQEDTAELPTDAPAVIRRYYPEAEEVFRAQGWTLPTSIDRVYVTEKAERLLGYAPQYNFAELLDGLRANRDSHMGA
ncbi:MAG TPA: NAD(P)-dependent oxidoreductase [Ktedonobacterales bacterium]|jgi:nucleoside-diphosphate-sugar epimerase